MVNHRATTRLQRIVNNVTATAGLGTGGLLLNYGNWIAEECEVWPCLRCNQWLLAITVFPWQIISESILAGVNDIGMISALDLPSLFGSFALPRALYWFSTLASCTTRNVFNVKCWGWKSILNKRKHARNFRQHPAPVRKPIPGRGLHTGIPDLSSIQHCIRACVARPQFLRNSDNKTSPATTEIEFRSEII